MADRLMPLLILIAGIVALVVGGSSLAATDEEGRKFRQQCSETRQHRQGDLHPDPAFPEETGR